MLHPPTVLVLLMLSLTPSVALELRTTDADDHERFDSFPVGSTTNQDHVYSAPYLTGAGFHFGIEPYE